MSRAGLPTVVALATATLGVVTIGSSFVPSRAAAWCQMTSEGSRPRPGMPCVMQGVPLSWDRRCMAYGIHEAGSRTMTADEVADVVARSFASWLAVTCPDGGSPGFDVRELEARSECDEAEFNQSSGNINTIAFIEDWSEQGYDPSAFALTTVWHDRRTGQILDADMQINEELGPYGVCPSSGCPQDDRGRATMVDLQNVVTHEAGHFFGLAHSEFASAAMAATSRRGETSKRILRTDDIEGFCSIYPPGSLPEECGFAPEGGLRVTCSDGGGCCAVVGRRSRGGTAWAAVGLGALALLVQRRSRRRSKSPT